MKFAKELDEHAVPEWRAKYLDYKLGKKKLKAVTRAVRDVDRKTGGRTAEGNDSPFGSSARDAPVTSILRKGRGLVDRASPHNNVQRSKSAFNGSPWQMQGHLENQAGASAQPQPQPVNERSPLRLRNSPDEGQDGRPEMSRRYGSIIGTPPKDTSPAATRLSKQSTREESLLELPDPALDPKRSKEHQQRAMSIPEAVTPPAMSEARHQPQPPSTQLSHTGNAYKIGKPKDGPTRPQPTPRAGGPQAKRTHTFPHFGRRPAFMRRVLSLAGGNSSVASNSVREDTDVALEAYREVDFRKADFFIYLDGELDKINDFYGDKEKEAHDRLEVLREQLHILRDRRNEEIAAQEKRKRKEQANGSADHSRPATGKKDDDSDAEQPNGDADHHGFRYHVSSQLDSALDKVRIGHLGKSSKAMLDLGTPNFRLDPNNLDYNRKRDDGISYRAAKRKLKHALVEYYRGLELMKNYALLNRTAFRKITKKCDKTIPWVEEQGPPGKAYMLERVDKAKFVSGDEIDTLLQTTEDYYARYFERGNRKMAISKLRSKHYKTQDFHAAFFRAGFFGSAGFLLSLLAVIKGADINFSPEHWLQLEAGYLLQIYGGYFLLLLAMLLFCVGCREFSRYKVNYKFILELNPRNDLDWRQLAEIPALLFFLLGLTMYLNFSFVGGALMFIYWPVILVGLSAIVLLAPLPEYYWKSRHWFAEAIWRLIFSGIYPVQFKDLFLGDMMCSQTYAFGNIELFFCLYARHWRDPPQCNSGSSMLLGFMTTLPAIWRLFQCLRRYYDTWAAFPHMANAGKYTCTILSYMTLSLFRLSRSHERLAVFASFSAINAIYCSLWDVIMDFSKPLSHCSSERITDPPFLNQV